MAIFIIIEYGIFFRHTGVREGYKDGKMLQVQVTKMYLSEARSTNSTPAAVQAVKVGRHPVGLGQLILEHVLEEMPDQRRRRCLHHRERSWPPFEHRPPARLVLPVRGPSWLKAGNVAQRFDQRRRQNVDVFVVFVCRFFITLDLEKTEA